MYQYGKYTPVIFSIFELLKKSLGKNFLPFVLSIKAETACSRDNLNGIILSGLKSPDNLPFITTGLWQEKQVVAAVDEVVTTSAPQESQWNT